MQRLNQIADDIADKLIGTCDTLDDAFERSGYVADRDNLALLELIDQQIFGCQSCQWWCCISEANDEFICNDCKDQDDEE